MPRCGRPPGGTSEAGRSTPIPTGRPPTRRFSSTTVAPRASASTTSPRPSPSPSRVVAPVVHGLRPPAIAGVTWYPEGLPVGGTAAAYVAHVDGGSIGLLW